MLEIQNDYEKFGIQLLQDDKGNIVAGIERKKRGDPSDITVEIFRHWYKGKGENLLHGRHWWSVWKTQSCMLLLIISRLLSVEVMLQIIQLLLSWGNNQHLVSGHFLITACHLMTDNYCNCVL